MLGKSHDVGQLDLTFLDNGFISLDLHGSIALQIGNARHPTDRLPSYGNRSVWSSIFQTQ
jgi:hypothetical protein